jgi:hypothetical protein
VGNVALFLGAGASRAVGYPTTEEFVTNLRSKLANEDKSLENMLVSLRESPQIEDVEHVLEFLDSLMTFDSNQYVRATFAQRHPQMFTKTTEYSWTDYVNLCRKLRQRIIDELHTQYEFDPTGHETVTRIYLPLFELLCKITGSNIQDVFTTNYDTVVEECMASERPLGDMKFKLVDGFPYNPSRKGRFWKPSEFEEEPNEKEGMLFRLFKLHGSLNWRETSGGLFECLSAEDKCQGGKRYKRTVLIYPTQKGLETEQPFVTMHAHFRDASSSSKIFLVIGFSFRDAIINRIFLEHLNKSKKHYLLVVSPNAPDNIQKNLLTSSVDTKKYVDQIGTIQGEFGKRMTADTIVRILRQMLSGK